MSRSAAPGFAPPLGAYPERRAPAGGMTAALARALQPGPRPAALAALAGRAEAEAAALARLGDEALREAALQAGLVLRREGLSADRIAGVLGPCGEAARRALGLRPYAVQMAGAAALLHGRLVELETGEGKTLMVALAAAAAALAGFPVHVVTANDYLVGRDAATMAPLHARLGLRTGAAREGADADARRAAYACDVAYVSCKQLGFDYLRDRSARGPGGARPPLLRGLCFAIVDEADSVLIDEARTPLLLARPDGGAEDAARHRRALQAARALAADVHFRVRAADRRVELTEAGRRHVRATGAGGREREEELRRALAALHVLRRDEHYIVRGGAIEIVDASTGRTLPDRSFDAGLQPLVEVKEGLAPRPPRETLARITYQRLFGRYLRLAGTTGTAREVAGELRRVYGLRTLRLAPRLPVQRRDEGLRVFARSGTRWEAVVECVREAQRAGRPVLVGTTSVASSERLGALLREEGIAHVLLNARQDAHEAEVIRRAGRAGAVTVATQMAGRGADILLGPGVAERGGLQVVAAEPGGARRVDRQLVGRCGRQGDPGRYVRMASLEDTLLRDALAPRLLAVLAGWLEGGPAARRLGRRLARIAVALAQRAAERRDARARRALRLAEDAIDEALAVAGPGE